MRGFENVTFFSAFFIVVKRAVASKSPLLSDAYSPIECISPIAPSRNKVMSLTKQFDAESFIKDTFNTGL